MASTPKVGDLAPDFTLDGTDGPFTLSFRRGERIVLAYYPGDETTVCTKQMCSYRDRADDLSTLGVTVIGISGKDVASKEAFRDHHGLTVPLLADTNHAVDRSYGVASRVMGAKRATFVIDEAGRITVEEGPRDQPHVRGGRRVAAGARGELSGMAIDPGIN